MLLLFCRGQDRGDMLQGKTMKNEVLTGVILCVVIMKLSSCSCSTQPQQQKQKKEYYQEVMQKYANDNGLLPDIYGYGW